LISHMRSLEGT